MEERNWEGWTALGTNLVRFTLRSTGSSLLLAAEPVVGGPQSFTLAGVQVQRFRYEGDALRVLERAEVGRWSTFPVEGIEATVTRAQLFQMGFRGNY
jgi:hypothetical protein